MSEKSRNQPDIATMLAAAYTKALISNPKDVVHKNIQRALNDCPIIAHRVNNFQPLVDALKEILDLDCPPEKLWVGDADCTTIPNPRLVNARAALAGAV